MNRKRLSNKIISILAAMTMTICLVPVGAMAADEGTSTSDSQAATTSGQSTVTDQASEADQVAPAVSSEQTSTVAESTDQAAVAETTAETTDGTTTDAVAPTAAETHTVIFMVGDEQFDSETVEAGAVATKPAVDPTAAAGKVFSGWYASADDAVTATNAFDFSTAVDSDLTLVAGFADEVTAAQDATTAESAAPAVATQSDPVLTPAAVGDEFTDTIVVGGVNYTAHYRILTESGTTGTVSLVAIDNSTQCSGDPVIPDTVTNNGVTYDVTTIGDVDGADGSITVYECVFAGSNITSTGLANNHSVTSLGYYVYRDCPKLTSTGLGSNGAIKTIGYGSFMGCANLTDTGLAANKSITTVGWNSFRSCTSLVDTGLGTNNTVSAVQDQAFLYDSALTNTGLSTNTTLKEIAYECFGHCTSLTDTGLGVNTAVTKVGDYAFWDCQKLASTGLAGNAHITSIGEGSYALCQVLAATGLETNSKLKTIGNAAFQTDDDNETPGTRPTALVNAAIGSGVTSIVSDPFCSSTKLQSVCYYGDYVAPGDDVSMTYYKSSTPIVYYLSENTTWNGKTAANLGNDVSALKSLSRLNIVNGSTTSKPATYWSTSVAGVTNGRWAEGETVSLTANAAPAGYTFAGWKSSDSTGTFENSDSANTTYTVGNSAGSEYSTVTAVYAPDTTPSSTYKVTYEVSGDVPSGYAVPTDSTAYGVDQPVTVAAVPTADGYTFSGWMLNGAQVTSTTMVTGGITLTGVWTKNSTVTPGSTSDTAATASFNDSSTAQLPKTADPLGLATTILLLSIGGLALGIFSLKRRMNASRD